MSIGEVDLDLDALSGYNVIVGENDTVADNAKSNGSGKSSIFESIVWCLTGETIRGNKDIVNHNSEGGTVVSVTFDCDGHTYIVSRYKEHKKLKTNLLITVDGEDKSGKGIRDSEKILQSYLPELTASLIGSVIVLGQGLPSRFTNNSPSSRKEVLETLTNSDFMIEDIKGRISKRKSELSTELRSKEDELLRLSTSIDMCNRNLSDLVTQLEGMTGTSQIEERQRELKGILQQHKDNLVVYTTTHNRLEVAVGEYTTEYNTLESQQNAELSEVKNEYTEKSGEIKAHIAGADASAKLLRRKLAEAKKVTDVCPTCGQKLPGVYIPNTSEDEEELKRLEDEISNLSHEHDRLRDEYLNVRYTEVEGRYKPRLRELTELIFKTSKERTEAISGKASAEDSISNVERMLLSIESDLMLYESKKATLIKDSDRLRSEIGSYEGRKTLVENEKCGVEQRLAIISKFESIVKRDFRGYLLQDIILYINKRAKVYCKTVFDTDLIEFALDGNNISISYNGKPYEALSGGERQKIDIIIQFSIRDVLCVYTGFHTNIIVLDEIFDNLDVVGSHRVIDLISRHLADVSGVFIISHHAKELNLPYDNEIIIRKNTDGVSHLV
jgi:DNA repair exonuclease SbcCD ATPase subunit